MRRARRRSRTARRPDCRYVAIFGAVGICDRDDGDGDGDGVAWRWRQSRRGSEARCQRDPRRPALNPRQATASHASVDALQRLTVAIAIAIAMTMDALLPSRYDKLPSVHSLTPAQFPCGRVKRFLKNNTQNKMRVGAKGMSLRLVSPFSFPFWFLLSLLASSWPHPIARILPIHAAPH